MGRRIVHETLYDTDKATVVSTVGNWDTYESEHESYWEGILYVTGKGNWFGEGAGGPATIFAREIDGAKFFSENILPISRGDALRMLERQKLWDVILKHFHIAEA